MMKSYLKETNLFDVEIKRFDSFFIGYKYNPNRDEAHEYFIENFKIDNLERPILYEELKETDFEIELDDADLVLLNIGENTPNLSTKMKDEISSFVKHGDGLVIIHAANNAWGDWDKYNKTIGLGAWGGRDVLLLAHLSIIMMMEK